MIVRWTSYKRFEDIWMKGMINSHEINKIIIYIMRHVINLQQKTLHV